MVPKLRHSIAHRMSDPTDHPEFIENPSVPRAAQSISTGSRPRLRGAGRQLIVGKASGEVIAEGELMIHEEHQVDRQAFTKVYAGEIGDMLKMPAAGRRVLAVVFELTSMSPRRDNLALHHNLCARLGEPMSRRTFNRGIADLLDAKLIYRTPVPHHYFIDVTRFFNGDRLHLVKTWQVRMATQQQAALEFDDVIDGECEQAR